MKLPSKEVESYTKEQPTSLTGTTLKYGEYADVEPFTLQEMRLHFENNSPFSVATNLVREVEVSHWGNVYVEEHYTIQHKGAKIRVSWQVIDSLIRTSRIIHGCHAKTQISHTLDKGAKIRVSWQVIDSLMRTSQT